MAAFDNDTVPNIVIFLASPSYDFLPPAGEFGNLTGPAAYHTYLGPDYVWNEYPNGKQIRITTGRGVVDHNYLIMECEVFIAEDDGVDGLIQEWEAIP